MLGRVDDMGRGRDDVRPILEDLRSDVKALDDRVQLGIDSLRHGSLGLRLLAIVGLLAMLLTAGA